MEWPGTRPQGSAYKGHPEGGDFYGNGRGVPSPTRHRPGTRGKIEVLRERARLGLVMHHPLDAR